MAQNLSTYQQFREKDRPLAGRINPLTNVEGSIARMQSETDQMFESLKKTQEQDSQVDQNLFQEFGDFAEPQEFTTSAKLVPQEGLPRVTQAFGNRNPNLEIFSGGTNLGTDFAVKKGTPLGLPPGQWQVVDTFNTAREGNRGANSGSGNLVRVVNTQTGESLAFEHLDRVAVRPGQVVPGGTVVGTSGNTGNSTGPHASIPYKDSRGQYRDILSTPYAKYIFGSQAGGGNPEGGKGGGLVDNIKSGVKRLAQAVDRVTPEYRLVGSPEQWQQMTPRQQQEIIGQNLIYGGTSPIGGQRPRFLPKQLIRRDDIGVADDVLRQMGIDKTLKTSNKNFIKNIVKETTNVTEEQLGKLSEGQLRNELIKLTNLAEDFYGTKDLARSRIGRNILDLAKSRLRR